MTSSLPQRINSRSGAAIKQASFKRWVWRDGVPASSQNTCTPAAAHMNSGAFSRDSYRPSASPAAAVGSRSGAKQVFLFGAMDHRTANNLSARTLKAPSPTSVCSHDTPTDVETGRGYSFARLVSVWCSCSKSAHANKGTRKGSANNSAENVILATISHLYLIQ